MPGAEQLLGLLFGGGASLAGAALDANQREEARKLLRQALAKYGLDDLANETGRPELQGSSAYENIRTDPELVAAQRAALGKFSDVIDSGGLTLEDQAVLNKTLGRAARNEGASRAAIAEKMAARGTAGAGTELAMNLQNQQAAAERANETGMSTAAMAQRRVYDAIMGKGQLAGNLRTQDHSEQARLAAARDAISQYNAQAKERAKNQKFNNRYQLAGAQAGQYGQLADAAYRQGQATRGDLAKVGAYGAEAVRPEAGGGSGYGFGDPYSPYYSGPSKLGGSSGGKDLEEDPPLVTVDDWDNPYGGY